MSDILAKEGVSEPLVAPNVLTFLELLSRAKKSNSTIRTPPRPCTSGSREDNLVVLCLINAAGISKHLSINGHLRSLSNFNCGKIFSTSTKCSKIHATPDHLLDCRRLDKQVFYSSPMLVLDFLQENKIMNLT
ncbi:hypothetical protein TNCV_3599561 [Trichonephila clavipes]|nr:hypothetical protein TNCV_3599561 [Trichonephila clavipes]